MKKSILSICLIFIINSCVSQRIIFSPIGDMDKPLPRFEISANPNDSGENAYYLSTEAFNLLNNNIKIHLNNCDSLVTDTVRRFWHSASYGSYEIIISTKRDNKVYFLDSYKKSHLFFEEQLPIFKENNDLYVSITILLNRL